MTGRGKKLLSENAFLAGFVLLVCILTVLFFVVYAPSTPDGDYHLHVFGKTADRLILKDGKMYVHDAGSTNRLVNVYSQSAGQWIIGHEPGRQGVIIVSPLGIGIMDPKTKVWHEYYPRSSLYWVFVGKVFIVECYDTVCGWFK